MAKSQPIQHPNTNGNPAPEGAEVDDDDEEEGGNFEKLLSQLITPATNKGGNENSMMVIMLMEQSREARREAREARREAQAQQSNMMNLVLSVMQGANNKTMDPLMVEIIKASLSGKQQEEFTRTMMTLQQNNATQSMEMMRTTMEQAAALKDKMTDEVIETIKENAANRNGEGTSPAMEIFREIRLMAEPIIAAKMGQPVKAPVTENPAQTPKTINAPQAKSEKELIPFILRALKHAQETPMQPAEKRSLRAKISIVIMDVPPLAEAVLNEDADKIGELAKPYVIADPVIFNWITKPEVAAWLQDYLKNQIAPLLDSYAEGEEAEAGIATDPPADDSAGNDGDDSEKKTA
jgi:hypothetical protein